MILAFGKPVSRAPDAHPLHSFKVRPRSKAPTFQAPSTQDLYAAAEDTGCYQEEAIANWPLLSQIPLLKSVWGLMLNSSNMIY